MEFQELNPDDPRPSYEQVADQIRAAIEQGTLGRGEQIPSRAELTAAFNVAPMTVQRALQELRVEGLIVSRQGKGVFVRNHPRQDADARILTASRLLRELHRSTEGHDPRCIECRDERGQLRRWPCRTIDLVDQVLDGGDLTDDAHSEE